jgi:hypothetical protein
MASVTSGGRTSDDRVSECETSAPVTLLAAMIDNKLAFDVSAEPSPATPPE